MNDTNANLLRATLTAVILVNGLVLLAAGGPYWWAVLPAVCGGVWCVWRW
jgi:hypothetical protein